MSLRALFRLNIHPTMITAPGWDDSLVFASNQQLVQQQDRPEDVREKFVQKFLDFLRSFRKNGTFIYRYCYICSVVRISNRQQQWKKLLCLSEINCDATSR